MLAKPACARSEFILGGQKSGKSRRAESLALDWLTRSPAHRAVLIATARPGDAEMRERIARHQSDRAERAPGLHVVEEPVQLAEALAAHSRPHILVVVDCLTLWLTNLLMPVDSYASNRPFALDALAPIATLLIALEQARGPVVLVGNEIGLGVIPLGPGTRAFVDALGRLNQDVAQTCERVTFLAAGLPLALKGQP